MSSAFDYARERTARFEGGWANEAGDRGGETMWGASTPYARSKGYIGQMEDLDRATVDRWFREDFWDELGLETIATADREVAAFLFDCAVNHSPRGFALVAQRAVTLRKRVAVDGRWGPQTRGAILEVARRTPENLLGALKVERGKYYYWIVASSPAQRKFLWGWMKRVS